MLEPAFQSEFGLVADVGSRIETGGSWFGLFDGNGYFQLWGRSSDRSVVFDDNVFDFAVAALLP